MNKIEKLFTNKDKALALYKFLREFCALDCKVICNIEQYEWKLFFDDIPNDTENVTLSYKDRILDNDDEVDDNRYELLSVKKPQFEKCPLPPENIKDWLLTGWDNYLKDAKIKELLLPENDNENKEKSVYVENFEDDPQRISDFKRWQSKRKIWQDKQQRIKITRDFFNKLYKLHVDLNDENETKELVVANGFITCSDNKAINHPILSKKVYTDFNSNDNIIKIYDSSSESELYVSLLTSLPEVKPNAISDAEEEVREKFYHPLDRNETCDFFKNFIHGLSSKSKFLKKNEIPDINTDDSIFLSKKPIYYVRNKVDGTKRVIEDIIKDIENGGTIPTHLCELISGGKIEIPEDTHELTIDEQLAETSGESIEILLSKEANREQLEIAKRVEKYNAVLVQGPPGTGKTHTIANLLGHFLAQGKNVLVTSYTPKALKVLKDKVPKELQSLCVSVLDDKSVDVEKSINGINEYVSKESSMHIKTKIQEIDFKRKQTIEQLAQIRKKIFAIRNSEYELISYNGESYSPIDIAKFIRDNTETLSYIPGKVAKNMALPLTRDELLTLYESNKELSEYEEKELNLDIVDPALLLKPEDFNNLIESIQKGEIRIQELEQKLASMNIEILCNNTDIQIRKSGGIVAPLITNTNSNIDIIDEFSNFISTFYDYEDWMVYAAVDGKKCGGYRQCWTDLIDNINKTVEFSDSFVKERFGKTITFSDDTNYEESLTTLETMKAKLKQNGKLSFFDEIFNKSIKEIKEKIKINDSIITTSQDCSLIINTIKLEKMRKLLCDQWNNLIGKHNYKKFDELDENDPEQIAKKFVSKINKYLDWYKNEYSKLQYYLLELGFNIEEIMKTDDLDSDITSTKKIFVFTSQVLPLYLELIKVCNDIEMSKEKLKKNKLEILTNDRNKSELCNALANANDNRDNESYYKFYNEIFILFNKTTLKQQREKLLEKLKQYAQDWAYSIQHRDGVYGESKIPVDIIEAWKYKQFENIIKELHSENYEQLQKNCFQLGYILKEQTAQLCEYKAWYHLLKRTEDNLDIKQALTGWKTMIKKIGKGTGKNVPRYLKEAKNLMIKCQKAVPAWIMPMSKALATLTPGENKFDVIIVDEASQSNISSLAIVYMAKKIIIVGDDKQVSPTDGFIDKNKINNLIDVHLKGVIPNPQAYEANTSLYEIAETTFTSLMLKEHFRCVPDIINFSNALSYDYKIKPLRDASSSNLQPAVINYKVSGLRDSSKKINLEEAKCIASLIAACIERDEYKDSTFGVISLLGTEQAKVIKDILLDKIDNIKYEHHKITCGEPPNFQGDERDVLFLSMVDSNDRESPLNMMNADGDRKRRYNVAVSRAKNQVWLIHSLDISKDLKEGDIRRKLIEYSMNPNSYTQKLEQIKKMSDSLFEQEICQILVAKGYNIIQQFPVSSFRIDMVACYGNKKVAIECDGEKYHSGEDKIREDMERQNIIERITKFNFIRIRGSEYNLNKEKSIDRIIKELNEYGIYPETSQKVLNSVNSKYPNLIEEIKIRAQQIREEWNTDEQFDIEKQNGEITTCVEKLPFY
jgi:hypothetical protein